jgi:hypothetical protein
VLRDDGAGYGGDVAQIATRQPGSRWLHWKDGECRRAGGLVPARVPGEGERCAGAGGVRGNLGVPIGEH